jgi:hypothetical protein
MFLGIEIGGTKLQLGIGAGDGKLRTMTHQNLHVPLDHMGIAESVHLTAFSRVCR